MTAALRFLLSVPFRALALLAGAAGIALVAFSLGMTLMAEAVAE